VIISAAPAALSSEFEVNFFLADDNGNDFKIDDLQKKTKTHKLMKYSSTER
jgi:hypothetical protein